MVCDSMLLEQSNLKKSSAFPDEKTMEHCNSTETIREPSETEKESKKREGSPVSATTSKTPPNETEKRSFRKRNSSMRVHSDELETPIEEIIREPSETEEESKKREGSPVSATTSKNHPNAIEKRSSRKRNSSMRVHSDELETPIEEARLDICNHFENMERQIDHNHKVMDWEVETWTRVYLASIEGGKTPLNDLLIKSLIDKFEVMIGNIELDSKRDVNLAMNEIRKIIVKLVKRIEQSFVPKPFMEDFKVTRRYIVTYLWIGLLSLIAVLICVFPDYALKFFESAVAFYQSTILVCFLFSMLYFCSPVCK